MRRDSDLSWENRLSSCLLRFNCVKGGAATPIAGVKAYQISQVQLWPCSIRNTNSIFKPHPLYMRLMPFAIIHTFVYDLSLFYYFFLMFWKLFCAWLPENRVCSHQSTLSLVSRSKVTRIDTKLLVSDNTTNCNYSNDRIEQIFR